MWYNKRYKRETLLYSGQTLSTITMVFKTMTVWGPAKRSMRIYKKMYSTMTAQIKSSKAFFLMRSTSFRPQTVGKKRVDRLQ